MKIGIVGLGLIGGSIFKALRDKYDVIGVSRTVEEKNVFRDYDVLKSCDIVFVCTPMNAALETLDKLEQVLPSDAIVADVCSVKTFVTKKKYKFRFIPSHPMAGTENSGWESSFPDLFKGAKWVFTPLEENVPEELEDIIKALGAQTVIMTPEEHDRAVAFISNLPLIIAQALCANIKDNKSAQILASSGFRDTTRLALSNLQMAEDMIKYNRENIELALNFLKKSIENLFQADYKQQTEAIKAFRRKLY